MVTDQASSEQPATSSRGAGGRGPTLDAHLRTADFAQARDLALVADDVGFRGLWTSEGKYDAYLPLAAATTAKTDLVLGTSVALALTRSPMATAYAAWLIQSAARGQFVLGLGTQVRAHMERRYSVPGDKPVERISEVIGALRTIWAHWQGEGPLDFDGEYYSFSLMPDFMHPGAIEWPDIPIYLGAVGPRMCRVVGRLADGISLHPLHSTRYIDDVMLPNIRAGQQQTGRPPESVEFVVMAFVATGQDDESIDDAREDVRELLGFYCSTNAYRPVLEVHGWEGIGDDLRLMARRGAWNEMSAKISDEMIDAFAVCGSPREVATALRSRYASIPSARIIPYEPFQVASAGLWAEVVAAYER